MSYKGTDVSKRGSNTVERSRKTKTEEALLNLAMYIFLEASVNLNLLAER